VCPQRVHGRFEQRQRRYLGPCFECGHISLADGTIHKANFKFTK